MKSIFSRAAQLEQLESQAPPWDIIVIGGGATGVGIAVDAASRGYRVALFERHDFGKGTSSRSTKLVHGGLRYLKQGRLRLVRDALVERGLLCRNAPHLIRKLPTVVPVYSRWESLYYRLGLIAYDALAGRRNLGRSRRLSPDETVQAVPTIESAGLYGSVSYLDGAFDDSRLLINLVQTAIEYGAVCLNYAPVRELVKESGRVRGVVIEEAETGGSRQVTGRVVVNATGPFTDAILRLDDPAAPPVIAPSQGIHLVFDGRFLPGPSALIVPKTPDGRVIFAIPWHAHAVVGTTDTPRPDAPAEPRPLPGEIDFIIQTIAPYLSRQPGRADIRSIFAGIRPLVRGANEQQTSKLGRDHQVRVSATGLVSVLGGKWTTYRRMAEDAVDRAATVGGLGAKPCRTKTLAIHGHPGDALVERFGEYGSDATELEQVIANQRGASERLVERLPYVAGQAIFAARHEMARTVEDVLARRLRALFLDADAALAAAPLVASCLAAELGRDGQWQSNQVEQFRIVADAYRLP